MDMKEAARIFSEGEIAYEHSGSHNNREYANILMGRPWVYPGEKIMEFEGRFYIVSLPLGPFDPLVLHDVAPKPYKR